MARYAHCFWNLYVFLKVESEGVNLKKRGGGLKDESKVSGLS